MFSQKINSTIPVYVFYDEEKYTQIPCPILPPFPMHPRSSPLQIFFFTLSLTLTQVTHLISLDTNFLTAIYNPSTATYSPFPVSKKHSILEFHSKIKVFAHTQTSFSMSPIFLIAFSTITTFISFVSKSFYFFSKNICSLCCFPWYQQHFDHIPYIKNIFLNSSVFKVL